MIALMKRADELSRAILQALADNEYKQDILAPVIGKSRQMVNKKLNLKSPFTYKEVMKIADFLGLRHLCCPEESSQPAYDPVARALLEFLSMLPSHQRREFYSAAATILQGYIGRSTHAPRKALQILRAAAKR